MAVFVTVAVAWADVEGAFDVLVGAVLVGVVVLTEGALLECPPPPLPHALKLQAAASATVHVISGRNIV